MFRFVRVLSLFALSVSATMSQAAGFDCQKAKTFVEKAICQDQTLSVLDEELGTVFKTALNNSNNPKTLKKQQLNWLKTKRDVCQTNPCLEKVYQARIDELSNVKTAKAATTAEYVRYDENGQPAYHSASLTIYALEKGKVKIVGSSTWVGDADTGNVHTGEVDGIFALQGDQVHYQDQGGCEFMVLMGKNALTVNNDNGQCGGANVTFNGYYKKIK